MAKPMTTKDKIREWISDNLRYMLLIGAILLIVAAVLLIVHLVSPKNDGKSSGGTVTSSSTGNNVPDKKTQVKADSKADSEDSTGISSDVSDSANDSSADASSTDTASAPDAEAEPTSEPEAADDTSNTENTDNTAVSFAADNVPEVSTVLEQYYTALGARDINGLFAVTDNLTAEEQAQIEAERRGVIRRCKGLHDQRSKRRNVHRVCQQQMQISGNQPDPADAFGVLSLHERRRQPENHG